MTCQPASTATRSRTPTAPPGFASPRSRKASTRRTPSRTTASATSATAAGGLERGPVGDRADERHRPRRRPGHEGSERREDAVGRVAGRRVAGARGQAQQARAAVAFAGRDRRVVRVLAPREQRLVVGRSRRRGRRRGRGTARGRRPGSAARRRPRTARPSRRRGRGGRRPGGVVVEEPGIGGPRVLREAEQPPARPSDSSRRNRASARALERATRRRASRPASARTPTRRSPFHAVSTLPSRPGCGRFARAASSRARTRRVGPRPRRRTAPPASRSPRAVATRWRMLRAASGAR